MAHTKADGEWKLPAKAHYPVDTKRRHDHWAAETKYGTTATTLAFSAVPFKY